MDRKTDGEKDSYVEEEIKRDEGIQIRRRKLKLFSPFNRELHIYHFSSQTLKRMLEKAGLKVIKIGFDRGAVGWGKRLLDYFSISISFLIRTNVSMGIKICALKE